MKWISVLKEQSLFKRSGVMRSKGVYAALASAFFLGFTPVFGKQAILFGLAPLAVVAIRTILAALLLLVVMFLGYRRYLYIYPAGMLGCLIAGWVNGIGSLFYYSALGRIDASLGQLLYSLYPLFLVLWLSLDRQPPSRLTILRLLLAIPAIILLVHVQGGKTDWVGVTSMLVASALYALHLPINQRFYMVGSVLVLVTRNVQGHCQWLSYGQLRWIVSHCRHVELGELLTQPGDGHDVDQGSCGHQDR